MNKLFFYSIVFLVTVIGGQDYDGGLDFEDGQDYEDYAENNNTTQDEPLELRLVDDLIADMTLASYGVYDVPNHLRKFQRVAERFLLRSFQLGSVVARSLYISREKQSVDYKALMKFNKVLAQLYENTTRALGYGLYSINVNASKPTVDYLKAVLEPLKIYRPYALKFTNPSVDKTQQEIVQLKELCLISKTPGDLIQIIREQAVKRCSPADKLTGVHGLISFLVSFCMRELMDQLNTIVQPYRELITQVSLKTKNAPDLNQFEESIRNSCSSNSYSGSLNRTLEHLPRTCFLDDVLMLNRFEREPLYAAGNIVRQNLVELVLISGLCANISLDGNAEDMDKMRKNHLRLIKPVIRSLRQWMVKTVNAAWPDVIRENIMHYVYEKHNDNIIEGYAEYEFVKNELESFLRRYGPSKSKYTYQFVITKARSDSEYFLICEKPHCISWQYVAGINFVVSRIETESLYRNEDAKNIMAKKAPIILDVIKSNYNINTLTELYQLMDNAVKDHLTSSGSFNTMVLARDDVFSTDNCKLITYFSQIGEPGTNLGVFQIRYYFSGSLVRDCEDYSVTFLL